MTHIPTLSARQLVRLADDGKLSLEFRLRWQKILYPQDPYNDLRIAVRYSSLNVFAGIFSVLFAFIYTFLGGWTGKFGIPIEVGVFIWFMPAAISWTWGWFNEDVRRHADEFRRNFSVAIYHLSADSKSKSVITDEDLMEFAEKIAKEDFDELRGLAKEAMIVVAQEVLKHSDTHPEEHNPAWHEVHSKLQGLVGAKYDALFVFGLVYGGYNYYYAEARKRMPQKSAYAIA